LNVVININSLCPKSQYNKSVILSKLWVSFKTIFLGKEDEYQFGIEEREVRGYDFLYNKEIESDEIK